MLHNKSTKKQLISNTVYQVIGKVVSMLITVLCTMIIAKTYGRESYGEFNLMQAWPAFVFIIVDFGLNAIATREITKSEDLAERYFNAVLYIRLFLASFFIVTMAIVLSFFPYSTELKQGIYLNLFLIMSQALYTTTNVIFQPKLRYDLSTIGYLTGYGYILLSLFVLAKLHVPVSIISFNYVIGGIISFIVSAYLIKNKLGIKINSTFDKQLAKQILVQSAPLGLMFVFSQINFKSDSLMLSVLQLPNSLGLNNTESVAVYGLAYKIFEVGLVAPTFFMNAAYPILVRHMTEGKEKLKESFINVIAGLGLVGVISAVVGIIASPLAINVLGGNAFSGSILVLRILLGGIFLYFLTQPLAWLIVTLDGQKYLPLVYLISAVFNLSANYIFIPKYAFYGSAVITHLSELLILFMLSFVAFKVWKQRYA